jgi:predicted RNA-binding Zn-ribbon protein involved in translation (DUF1610 family)
MSVDYKYKPNKHTVRTSKKTIDEMHKEYVNEFKKNRDSVPNKKKKIQNLEKELKNLSQNNGSINLDIEVLKKKSNIRKEIKKLNDEIQGIESYNDEMNYYSRTCDVIYDYYDLTNGMLYGKDFDQNLAEIQELEQKQEQKQKHEQEKVQEQKSNIGTNATENDLLSKSKPKIMISDELLAITNQNRKRKLKRSVKKRNKKNIVAPTKSVMSLLVGSDDEDEDDEEKNVLCRATLQTEYLVMMDKEYACSLSRKNNVRKCKVCGVDLTVLYNESIASCPVCGEFDEIVIESDIPSHRETFNEKPKYPYRRIGHCIEKLNQFLCKGTANIPQDVFDILDEEVKKHGLGKDEITIKFLEKMLKKHRLSDYYEYIMFIYSKITNTSPHTITREEHELVLKMFAEANDVFEKKFKPKDRDNFLKYTFVLNKIFLTINKKKIASHFKLLKSPYKMKEQERIWQLICNDLGWKYHGS